MLDSVTFPRQKYYSNSVMESKYSAVKVAHGGIKHCTLMLWQNDHGNAIGLRTSIRAGYSFMLSPLGCFAVLFFILS